MPNPDASETTQSQENEAKERDNEQFQPKKKQRRVYKPHKSNPELVSAWKQYDEAKIAFDHLLHTVKIKEKRLNELLEQVKKEEAELEVAKAAVQSFETFELQVATDVLFEAEAEYKKTGWIAGWIECYKKLVAYKDVHGHVNLPTRCYDNRELDSLCVWLSKQRRRKRQQLDGTSKTRDTARDSYQLELLDKLGVQWTILDDQWDERVEAMLAYKAVHGHCNVPQNYKEDKQLGNWVSYLRNEMLKLKSGKRHALTEERIKMLDEAGFVWNMFEQRWKEMYQRLVSFNEENGHTILPSFFQDTSLVNWAKRQREEYIMYQDEELRKKKKCRLTPERIELLDNIGFNWFDNKC